jgi:hypothetical protein
MGSGVHRLGVLDGGAAVAEDLSDADLVEGDAGGIESGAAGVGVGVAR